MKKTNYYILFSVIFVLFIAISFFYNNDYSMNDIKTIQKTVKLETTNETIDVTRPIATIDINGFGVVKAELYPEIAPNTVSNFIQLANSNFYDGLTFHRVVKDFVVQGGCPNGDGTGDAGYYINGEFSSNGFKNNLKHEPGVLSMARALDNNSASSQFFIVTGNASHLDGQYAGFGKVIEGMDIINKLNNVQVDTSDMPINKITINSITVDTKGMELQSVQTIN